MPRLTPIAAALGLCLLASPALAHAGLVESTPTKGATVPAPKTIKLTFSEKVSPAFSGFRLSMKDGMVIDFATKVSSDGMTLTGTPTSSFMKGKYTLNWHAVSVDDGHRTEGSFDFTVK